MSKFMNRPVVKTLLLGVWVLIIGGICSALGNWDFKNDKYIYLKIIFLFVFSISYIVLLIYYSTKDFNNNKELRILQNQNKAFEAALISIISICQQTSKNVNKVIKEIVKTGKFNLNVWSFDISCELICEKVYNLICELHGESKSFGVGYVRLMEEKGDCVCMNAYYNQDMSSPSILKKIRKMDENEIYHDVELFKANKTDIEVIIGKENINNMFSYQKKESRQKNKEKYNQYIAIPVSCSKDEGSKMVGLLEVICLNDTELANTEAEVREVASKYLVPYAYFLLLLHKLEKALKAQPEKKEAQL